MVIRADSDPARQALFANLMQSRAAVRLAFGAHERLQGRWAGALLVSGFGIAAFLTIARPRTRGARLLGVARHENALRQVRRIFSWVGDAECALVPTGARAVASASTVLAFLALLGPVRAARVLRIIRRVDLRFGFLVACRVAAALAWYARSLAILRSDPPGAVLVSSDSNPEELGFVAAARRLGVPQVFVSHAYPTPLSPPLDFTLSILEGEAAVNARARKGPIKGAVLLAGVEGEPAPLDPRRLETRHPVVGVFTSKALSWPTLATIIDDCRRHLLAREVIIRWHPSMLETPHLTRVLPDVSGVVESARSASLADVARRCDWVIADENSNVHLPVLKLGVPTVPVKHLGVYPESRADQYGFVARGVVPHPVASVRQIDIPTLVSFFSGSWAERFEQYDAAYLRPTEAVAADVRHAILQLTDASARAGAADVRSALHASAG